MATSGTITHSIRTGYALNIAWEVDSQSVANNTSTVTARVQLVSTGASYTINSTANKTGKLTINGTSYSFDFTASLSGNQTKTIFTKTVTITHSADGSKSCAFSASAGINVTLSGTYYGTVSASGTGVFNTIPRATTPTLSASAVDMGASITITMSRASDSFDHTLTYSFGGTSGTIGSDLGTSRAWTVPLTLASQIPNATSGICTITCKTYNGTTLIGTKTVTFTARVPASVVPTISNIAAAETVTGLAAQFGAFVQSKSKIKFTITASGAYGSTISAYKTEFDGKTYSGATPTSYAVTSSGTVNAKVTVTDSRGRTATLTKGISVTAYKSPQITAFSVLRSLADGTANNDGANAKVTAAFSISSVGSKNTNTYKVEYKLQSSTTWSSLLSGSGYSYNSSTVTGAIFNVDNSYDVRLTVTDYFGSVSKIVEISTAFTLLDFNASGKGMGIGKVSESNALEIAMPTEFSYGETPSSPIYLQTGTDLNTVLNEGYYSIPTTAISGSLLNKPWATTATGTLVVLNQGNGGQRLQIAYKGTKGSSQVFQRCYYGSAWEEWYRTYSGEGNILWAGGLSMTSGQSASLSEPVSRQPNGIVLIFSRYSSSTIQNYHYNHFFVHKAFIAAHAGVGSQFLMTTDGSFSVMASKYLYINETAITGGTNNGETGTANGITYNNGGFVLRYVIGV